MKLTCANITLDEIAPIEKMGIEAIENGDAVFDFTEVTKADSAMLALLLQWIRKSKSKGLVPEIKNMPEGMWSLARLYGVRELLRPYCQKH